MKAIITYLTVALLFLSPISMAQKPLKPSNVGDSTVLRMIPLEKIPVMSLQATVEVDQLAKSIIDDNQLGTVKAVSDSMLIVIDSLLQMEDPVVYDSLLPRILVSKKNFWITMQEKLVKQRKEVEAIMEDLSSKSNQIEHALALWENTKTAFDSTYTDSLMSHSIKEIIEQADSVQNIVRARTPEVFRLLRHITQYEVKTNHLLTAINEINRKRQEAIFEKTDPSIVELNYTKPLHWGIERYLKLSIQQNLSILNQFYRNNATRLLLYAGYLLMLFTVFFFLKKKSTELDVKKQNIYQYLVLKILRRPFSLAVILGIFSSSLFFSSRPPIFADVAILVLTLPIIDISIQASGKKGIKFLIIFALLILLRLSSNIFPPATLLHRLLLLITGSLEVVFLIGLLRNLNISNITSQSFGQFVRILIFFHLGAVMVGTIANLTGHLALAEITIDLPVTNTLVGLLLIISSITLIGLIQLAVDGRYLGRFRFLKNRKPLVKRRVALIILFVAILFWIHYILQMLRISDIVYDFISSTLNARISVGSASFTMGGVLLFFFIIWLSVVISGMLRAILEDDVLNKLSLKKGVPRMISVVLRFSLISVGLFLAVSAIGMPLNQLTIIFSAFGVGIGFGLQNVVSNFVSGVILLFERPVQIGDTVQVGELIGTVKSMGIRSSNVRTFDGAEVVVPNANLVSNEVINWTLSDKKRRIEIISGVAYGSDVYLVQKILLDILSKHPDVLQNPEPLVLFNQFGESSLDFRLLFWTDNFDRWIIIKSEVIFKIHDALKQANITVPFPQRDLHIKSYDMNKNQAQGKQK